MRRARRPWRSRRSGDRRTPCLARAGHMPERVDAGWLVVGEGHRTGRGVEAQVGCGGTPRLRAAAQAARQAKSARSPRPRRSCRRQSAGNEGRRCRRTSAACAPVWVVSATCGFQPPETASISRSSADARRPCASRTVTRARAAMRVEHGRAEQQACAALARQTRRGIGDVQARIDHGLHATPAAARSMAVRPAIIGRGEHHDLPAGQRRRSDSRRCARPKRVITPGRSLPPNTIGRSMAPAARTDRLATICQRR